VFHWNKLGDADIEGTIFGKILQDKSFKMPVRPSHTEHHLAPQSIT
jgi:hypothetical protein